MNPVPTDVINEMNFRRRSAPNRGCRTSQPPSEATRRTRCGLGASRLGRPSILPAAIGAACATEWPVDD
jgi:hypothetical protein